MNSVIKIENLSKRYRLGTIGRTALHEDLSRWWARLRRQPDPTLRIGQGPLASALRDDSEHIWALRDVSFEVAAGEILGIIGRNGAGKSTLLKILARVTAPTLGRARIKGRIASLLEVGTGFHPELTGRENIFLNGAILGMSRAEVRRNLDAIIAFAEIGPYVDTPVKRYSSGMYVRLAFAVAAHLEADILLVDEVLAVGDLAFQRKCIGKMGDVATQGRTVLFVSHNMGSVRELCSSILWLSRGAGLRRGAPEVILGAYLREGLADSGVVTIAPARHRVHSPLSIEKLEILDGRGVPSAALLYGDAPGLRLHVAVATSLEDVRLGIELHAAGGCLASFHTPALALPAASPAKPHVIQCRLPPGSLLPGAYRVHVGAHRYTTGVGLDWVPDVGGFSVENAGLDGAAHDRRETGLVRIPTVWTGLPGDGREGEVGK